MAPVPQLMEGLTDQTQGFQLEKKWPDFCLPQRKALLIWVPTMGQALQPMGPAAYEMSPDVLLPLRETKDGLERKSYRAYWPGQPTLGSYNHSTKERSWPISLKL